MASQNEWPPVVQIGGVVVKGVLDVRIGHAQRTLGGGGIWPQRFGQRRLPVEGCVNVAGRGEYAHLGIRDRRSYAVLDGGGNGLIPHLRFGWIERHRQKGSGSRIHIVRILKRGRVEEQNIDRLSVGIRSEEHTS